MLTKYANSCYAHCNWLCDAVVAVAVVALWSRSLDLVCSLQLCVSQLCKVSCVEPLTMNCKCEQRATWAATAKWCVATREREAQLLSWVCLAKRVARYAYAAWPSLWRSWKCSAAATISGCDRKSFVAVLSEGCNFAALLKWLILLRLLLLKCNLHCVKGSTAVKWLVPLTVFQVVL